MAPTQDGPSPSQLPGGSLDSKTRGGLCPRAHCPCGQESLSSMTKGGHPFQVHTPSDRELTT